MIKLIIDGEHKNKFYNIKSKEVIGIGFVEIPENQYRDIDVYDRFNWMNSVVGVCDPNSDSENPIIYGETISATRTKWLELEFVERLPEDFYDDKVFLNGSTILIFKDNEFRTFLGNTYYNNAYHIYVYYKDMRDDRIVRIMKDKDFKDMTVNSVTIAPIPFGKPTVETVIKFNEGYSIRIVTPKGLTEINYQDESNSTVLKSYVE